MATSVHLIRGDDPVLVSEALLKALNDVVGDADRSLVLEELTEAHYRRDDATDLGPLVYAAGTAPFLADFRVVVGRELSLFTKADQVASLVAYLADPLPTTRLVLVWERGPTATRLGAPPKSLVEAIAAAGGSDLNTKIGTGRAASAWLESQFVQADVALDRSAKQVIGDTLGDERSRVGALLATLASVFGAGAKLDETDVAPYLGEAGGVPPWELTDAMAQGNVAESVSLVHRMTSGGDRHPLQITATLNSHYQRLLRLDGADAANEKAAAALLGMKGSTFPAKKALSQSLQMGGARIARSIELLAAADLDLRGATARKPEAVLELVVARLAQLSRH